MFEIVFLNNALETWIYAFIAASFSILLGRTLYWIIQKKLKTSEENQEKKLNAIILDTIEEPLSFAIALFGFWFALDLLTLAPWVKKIFDSIFYFLIIFNVAWFATRFFDIVIEKYIEPKVRSSDTDLDDVLLPIIRKIIKVTIWAITIVIGIDNAGYDVTAMITGLGVGGLVFALAAKDAVSNLFGGFVIFSDKPFKLNDRIILNGHEGFVREIGLRSTKLETLDGRYVTIPNSNVTDNAVLNVSQEKGRKVKFSLGLTYDTSPQNMQKAKQILEDIIHQNEDAYDGIVAFESFGDFSLNILLIYWIKSGSPIIQVQDAINMKILSEFNNNSLNFAFPTQTIIVEK